jgi:phosphoglucomutase
VDVLHAARNPGFGGHPLQPAAAHLGELAARVRADGQHLGLPCDGNADRFGVLDADGVFMKPDSILALLAAHLPKARKWSGGLARSVASTHLLDQVAARHGRPLHETPVGFKYIGILSAPDALVLGGEERVGLSVRGHVPEKDGILACLLVAELVAAHGGRSLRSFLADLYAEVDTVLARRINVSLEPVIDIQDAPRAPLEAGSPARLAGRAVARVNPTDGLKLLLEDGSWILLRPSGTEPMARLYLEAPTAKVLDELEAAGRALLSA